jgi:hypothetical protein
VIGKRLEPGDPPGAEQPLLLDPYGTDAPSEYLWFEDNGTVRPISKRGDVTIEVLALNRPNLVARRREAAGLTQSVLAAAPEPVPANTRAALIDPHNEYIALRRQLLERHLARAGTKKPRPRSCPRNSRDRAAGHRRGVDRESRHRQLRMYP